MTVVLWQAGLEVLQCFKFSLITVNHPVTFLSNNIEFAYTYGASLYLYLIAYG